MPNPDRHLVIDLDLGGIRITGALLRRCGSMVQRLLEISEDMVVVIERRAKVMMEGWVVTKIVSSFRDTLEG